MLAQMFTLCLWLLAAILSGLVAIYQFHRTGQSQSTLVIVSVALVGSFMYFFWPLLEGSRYTPYVNFALFPAAVIAITALVLPVLVRVRSKPLS